mgnify:CR=1 FL=1
MNIWTGNLVKYSYDILGRRTKKIDSSKSTTNPETTIYVYSGDNILSEYKTVGSWSLTFRKNYINWVGTDSVIAYDVDESTNQDQISFCQNRVLPYQIEFTTYGYTSIVDDCNNAQNSSTGIVTNRYYYHTNQLGSIIALTNSTGAVVQVYSYDAFGKVYVNNSGSLVSLDTYTGNTYWNTRLYTGREYDKESNLYYMRARYYSPDTGRFISRDPIWQNDQVNLYTYVANSPLKYTDRMGREKVLIFIWADNPWSDLLKNWADYQYRKYLAQGIKAKNIKIIPWIVDPTSFNNEVDKYNGNIKEMVYLSHWAPTYLWGEWTINSENVSQLHKIKKIKSNAPINLTLIACNAWKWENPIAQQISNATDMTVTAYSNYVLFNQAAQLSDGVWAFILWNLLVHLPLSMVYDTGENTKFGEKSFTPNL